VTTELIEYLGIRKTIILEYLGRSEIKYQSEKSQSREGQTIRRMDWTYRSYTYRYPKYRELVNCTDLVD